MPRFRAVGPDGKTYEAEAPDEQTFRAHVKRTAQQSMRLQGYSDVAGGLATVGGGLFINGYDELQGGMRGVADAATGAARDLGQGRNPLPQIGRNYQSGYRKGADQTRYLQETFSRRRPWTALLLTGTGGALPLAATMAAAPQAAPSVALRQVATRRPLATAATIGAGYGAAGHVLGGVTPEERFAPGGVMQDAALGAGIGAVLHGAVKGASGVADLVQRSGLTPEQRAARIVNRGLERSGMTPDDLEVNRRKLGPGASQETIAEVGGRELQAQARAVANVEGPGRQIAGDMLDVRAAGVGQRTMSEMARGLPKAKRNMSVEEAEDALRAARSGDATQGYRAAYAQPLNQDVARQTVVPLMRQGSPEALSSAARQLDTEVLRVRSKIADLETQGMNVREPEIAALYDDLADIQRSQAQLRALSAGENVAEISTRAIDYYQRGLRQMAEAAGMRTPEGSALAAARDTFNNLADRVAPTFGQTRVRYGEASRALEMMEMGKRLLNETDGAVARETRNLTVEQRDALIMGALDQIQTKINANDTAFVARFAKNKNWQKVLTEALGDRSAKRIITRIRREAAMNAFRNYVLSGSRTTPLADDIRMLTEGESELKFLTEFIEQGGNVQNVVLRKVAEWWRRQAENSGIRDPRVNEALARMLYSKATGGATGGVATVQAQIKALPKYAQNKPGRGRSAMYLAPPLVLAEQQKRRQDRGDR